MRLVIVVLSCLLLTSIASAEKPVYETPPLILVPCGLTNVTFDWDFATGSHDFTTSTCDDQGNPVWEYGSTTFIDGAPGNVWGTVLEGDYLLDSGEGLLTPAFTVSEEANRLEIFHYYAAEHLWDGGNVSVNGQTIVPDVGYPGVINVPSDWYAWCVDFEWGFTGLNSGWMTSCFDLSAYLGQTIQVSFDFGSDDQFVEAGWYLSYVKVGYDGPVATQSRAWSAIKSLYR